MFLAHRLAVGSYASFLSGEEDVMPLRGVQQA